MQIPPVLVLSTGRCGSTMVSEILNHHPEILSISEFFSNLGMRTFRHRRSPTGEWIWDLLSRHRIRTGLMVKESYSELLYPFDHPHARYSRSDIPPVLCTTLPHLTERYEAFFEELEFVVHGQPLAAHFHHLFGFMCAQFDCTIWAERSGGSLMFASALMREFPEARVVYVYRDGRDTAISMSRHYPFRMLVANIKHLKARGVDIVWLLSRDRLWDLVNPWLEPLVNSLVRQDRVNYDALELTDFGVFWNALVEKGRRAFASLPADRLLEVRFEDVQAQPYEQVRRLVRFIDPSLEDEAWLREMSSIPGASSSRYQMLLESDRIALTRACAPGLDYLGYPI